MKKSLSFILFLSLFLLFFWGVSAWFIGAKTNEKLRSNLSENELINTEIFQLSMEELSSSLFTTTAKVIVFLNEQNSLTSLFKDRFNQKSFNLTIKHGPILLGNSGVSFGRGLWEFIEQNPVNNSETEVTLDDKNEEQHDKQLATEPSQPIQFAAGFDDVITYQIPLHLYGSKFTLEGSYNPKTTKNSGSIVSDKVMIVSENHTFHIQSLYLSFKSINVKKNKQAVVQHFKVEAKELDIAYQSTTSKDKQALLLALNYDGKASIDQNLLNSEHVIHFNNNQKTDYPLESGRFDFKTNALNIESLSQIIEDIEKLKNLNDQSQWVLEEQGELPEGQDQIWRLQDQRNQSIESLPISFDKVLYMANGETPVFSFSLSKQFKGGQSKVVGDIQRVTELSYENDHELSLLSQAQVNAKVDLDDKMLKALSQHLPIEKKQFNLLYKHNKLLMQ